MSQPPVDYRDRMEKALVDLVEAEERFHDAVTADPMRELEIHFRFRELYVCMQTWTDAMMEWRNNGMP